MKIKRIAALTLALLMTLAVYGGFAENIFGNFQEDEAEQVRQLAPSYGAMANVSPDQVEPNAEGGTIVTYLNVSAAGINQFGTYLGTRGFSVSRQEEKEGRTAFAVSDGQVEFVTIYDPESKILQLIYPRGTDYEEPRFPGYTQIGFNEEISVPGLGRFTFHDFVLDDKGRSEIYYLAEDWQKRSRNVIHSWLSFTFHNTSTNHVYFGYVGSNNQYRNDLLYATLVYQNADGTYEHSVASYGRFDSAGKRIAKMYPTDGRGIVFSNESCRPLGSMEYAVSFSLADGLRSSSDGTIAIKLLFATGEKYVLVARENGVDLNIAPRPEK